MEKILKRIGSDTGVLGILLIGAGGLLDKNRLALWLVAGSALIVVELILKCRSLGIISGLKVELSRVFRLIVMLSLAVPNKVLSVSFRIVGISAFLLATSLKQPRAPSDRFVLAIMAAALLLLIVSLVHGLKV
jgi:hypothetical protein